MSTVREAASAGTAPAVRTVRPATCCDASQIGFLKLNGWYEGNRASQFEAPSNGFGLPSAESSDESQGP